jgi:hypothetical protein
MRAARDPAAVDPVAAIGHDAEPEAKDSAGDG